MYFFLSNSVFFLVIPSAFDSSSIFSRFFFLSSFILSAEISRVRRWGKQKQKRSDLFLCFKRLVDYDWLAGLFASGNSGAICGHPSQPPSLVYRRTRSLAQFLMALPVSRNCIRHLYRNRDCCKADCHSSAMFRSLPSRFFLVSYALGSLALKIFFTPLDV